MSQQLLTITVDAPAAEERLQPGQKYLIKWRSTGAVSHTVKLSTNGGNDYSDIAASLAGSARSFEWTVPELQTNRARIRVAVRDAADNRLTGDTADFTISRLTQPAPAVTSLNPTTGPVSGGTPVVITGRNFVAGCKVKFGGDDAQVTSVTDASLSVVTPRKTSAGVVNLRVTNPDQQVDVKEGAFTYLEPPPTMVQVNLPPGGTFETGQRITVEWTTTGPVASHSVRLSLDGGQTFSNVTTNDLPASANSHSFNLPPPPAPAQSAQAVIRIAARDALQNQVAKGDSQPFTLKQPPPPPPPPPASVNVSKPDGANFQAGQQVVVEWQTTGQVFAHAVRIAFDGGEFGNVTMNDLGGGARAFTFLLPNPPRPMSQAVVRVVAKDAQGNQVARGDSKSFTARQAPVPTSVKVNEPAGGTFQSGQRITARWQTTGPVAAHAVGLTFDGVNVIVMTQADLPGPAQSFAFNLPDPPPPSANAQARVVVTAKDANGAQLNQGVGPAFNLQKAPPPPPPQPSAPFVTSVGPSEGATTGGRVITVQGGNFVQGAALFVGGNPAQDVRVMNAQTIMARTPERSTAGEVNVRVQNPDGKDATLPKGFKYNYPPVITSIDPDNGPVNTDGKIVVIQGMFFRPGVQVFFKDAAAVVRSVDGQGQSVEVVVPRSATAGAVRVKVLNPDEGEARKPDGYRYLGEQQQQRARIRKVFPTAILEGDDTPVTVYGNNLHAAQAAGTFAVRTSKALKLEWTNVRQDRDPATQEEIIRFNLKVTTPDGTPPLGSLQRGLVEVVADRRPDAARDGLVSSFKTIAVLPRALPIAISFTASVTKNRTSVMVVAGNNLSGAVLTMDERPGVSLEHQYSDDKVAVALVAVDDTADAADLRVKLLDKNSAPVVAPLAVKVQPGQAAARTVTGDDRPDVDVSALAAVPDQVAIGPTAEDSIAYNLSATPGTPATFSGVPDPTRANLVAGAAFDIIDETLEIPLFNFARQLTLFDKGGLEITAGELVLRDGTIREVRNLTLLLMLDIKLTIRVRVTVFFGLNPFADFDSPDPFLGPFEGSPALPSNAFGVVLLGFRVRLNFGVFISLFAGLVAPRDSNVPDLVFKRLAVFFFDVTFGAGGKSVTIDRRFTFTIKGSINPLPLNFGAGLERVGGGFRPDRPALGFAAAYFARKPGEYCDTFNYNASPDFKVEFSSSTGESIAFPPLPLLLRVCVKVKAAARYRVVRIEPKEVFIDAGQRRVVTAFAKLVDIDGVPLDDKERELNADEVTFRPADDASARIFRTEKSAIGEPTERWRVVGIERGAGRLLASVTTAGRGNSVLPRAVTGFFLPTDRAKDAEADLDTGLVTVNAATGELQLFLKEENGGRAIGDVWVYLKDTPRGDVLRLRTGGGGEVKALRRGGVSTMPDQYTEPFSTTPKNDALIYYSRGAYPIPARELNERSQVFFKRNIVASQNDSGRAEVALPDIPVQVSAPLELNLWPLLFELPGDDYQKSGVKKDLAQGADLFNGLGVVKTEIGEGANVTGIYGEPVDSLRPRVRGLAVRGAAAKDATAIKIRVLKTDDPQSVITLRDGPDGPPVNEVAATLALKQQPGPTAATAFDAAIYFNDPTELFRDGRLVQVLIAVERKDGQQPLLVSVACQPVGLQVVLVKDGDDGMAPGRVLTEADEVLVVDFKKSPSPDITAQGQSRRMVPYPISIRQRSKSDLPMQPEMPMWMAELHLVGLGKSGLENMLARRRKRVGPAGGTIRLLLDWKLNLSWHGPEEKKGKYAEEFTTQKTADNRFLSRESVFLQLKPDSDTLNFTDQNKVTNAFSPPPGQLGFPVPQRRLPIVTLDAKRRWGRRAAAPEFTTTVIEWQPAVVDKQDTTKELIRGADGVLSLAAAVIDNAPVDRGFIRTDKDVVPAGDADPVARVPVFRIPGHKRLTFEEAFALSDAVVRRVYDRLVADKDKKLYVGLLSLACWQDTMRRIIYQESRVRHYRVDGGERVGTYGRESQMPSFNPANDYGICQLSFGDVTTDHIWSIVANIEEGARRVFEEFASRARTHIKGAPDFFKPGKERRSRAAFQRETVRRYNAGLGNEFKASSISTIKPDIDNPKNIGYPNSVLAIVFPKNPDGTLKDNETGLQPDPARAVGYKGLKVEVPFTEAHFGDLTGEAGVSTPSPKSVTFTPAGGAAGTTITVAAQDFDGVTGVKVGEQSVPFNFDPQKQLITFVIPEGIGGGLVSVVSGEGTLTSTDVLEVTPRPGSDDQPAVSTFFPAAGVVGTQVSVSGANFTNVSAVRFNGVAAVFGVRSAVMLTAVVPAGAATGLVTVTTPAGTARSASAFSVLQPPKGKESKEAKEKEGKEVKESKEVKDKEKEKDGKERKEIKERKEGKEFGEFLGGERLVSPRVVRPAADDGGVPTERAVGRAFISAEERPAVGRRILSGEEKERGR